MVIFFRFRFIAATEATTAATIKVQCIAMNTGLSTVTVIECTVMDMVTVLVTIDKVRSYFRMTLFAINTNRRLSCFLTC